MGKKMMQGKLVLENGKTFSGVSFGYPVSMRGEVVFNTGMTGYPESLTDSSYRGQILVLTYPLIGNYGVPRRKFFFESERIQIAGLVVQDYSFDFSHWRADSSLAKWLQKEKIPALSGVDTRLVTSVLRERGVMRGRLEIAGSPLKGFEDPNKRNLVEEVSIAKEKSYIYKKPKYEILFIDCGVKFNIIRSLQSRGAAVRRVPWDYQIDIGDLKKFDGFIVSNGPGDPKMCKKTIQAIRKVLAGNKPFLGICLGCQLLGLAIGADTYKLKYGHRSQNQPCLEVQSGRCFITTQNHGYTIRKSSIPNDWRTWFLNINDGTVEGIRHKSKPWLAVQFHPEANPGPRDTEWVFDEFLKLL